MGKLALAAKITHVPSMYLSEFPGPNFGCRDAAINGHKEIDRRCRALGVDTIVVFDVHWQVNSEYHINCGPKFEGVYTSNELPHFIKNMPYAYPGNPELGHLIADMANAMGVKSRAHSDTTLELEYGTLVPMRYMNADQHYKVISVSGWCDWHDLNESGRFGLAVRARDRGAVRRHGGGVRQRLAVAPLRRQRPRARVHAQGVRPVPGAGRPPRGRAVEGRRLEDLHRHAARCTPTSAGAKATCTTRPCCWACWAGTATRQPAEDRHAVLRQLGHRADQRDLPGDTASGLTKADPPCRTWSSSTRPTSKPRTDMTALCRALADGMLQRARRSRQAGVPHRRHARAGLSGRALRGGRRPGRLRASST